jgi:hypothetical protein
MHINGIQFSWHWAPHFILSYHFRWVCEDTSWYHAVQLPLYDVKSYKDLTLFSRTPGGSTSEDNCLLSAKTVVESVAREQRQLPDYSTHRLADQPNIHQLPGWSARTLATQMALQVTHYDFSGGYRAATPGSPHTLATHLDKEKLPGCSGHELASQLLHCNEHRVLVCSTRTLDGNYTAS